ncbi:MAG TPA: PKD domain-containing protein [Thermoanaerobaculia bacterium]
MSLHNLHRMLALLALPAFFLLARPMGAQVTCDRAGCGTVRDARQNIVCFTPATPVAPTSLWGEIQPADSGRLPRERDTTDFNEVTQTYDSRNWFYGVEIQNNWILMGLSHGIGIWDAHTDPANPAFVVSKRYSSSALGGFPFMPSGEQAKIVFGAIAAPDDTVAALAGYSGTGILVIDLSDKTMPRAAYQNMDKTSQSIYAAKLGGGRYAFMASSIPSGLYVYNLDQAVAASNCLEDSTSTGAVCPGAYVGAIPTAGSPTYVHGAGNYVAVSFGAGNGFQIFDVSNPASPVSKLNASTGRPVQGIAMWNQGTSYYVAARLGQTLTARQPQLGIYDVSCIATGGCSGLGAPVALVDADTQSGSEYLTFSRSGSTPFLYLGGDAPCPGADGLQHEWLFDVTNPAAPHDVSPQATTQMSALYGGVSTSKPVGYWSYYYRPSPTGFNLVSPRAGKFNGQYFYRAARSIFDIHKLARDIPPTANFSWNPTEIYPGTPVTFTDGSSGAPTSWSWTFQDGAPASSSLQSPLVTFTTAGTKSVSLSSTNGAGTGSATQSVTVLTPAPQIGSITVSPANPLVCQPVTFTATGVTGQSPLAYAWTLNGTPQAATTSTFTWDTTGAQSGLYTAALTLTNGSGTATKSASVNLLPLPQLAFTGANGAPENDPFTAGTVKFHAKGQGATAWNWDFGDGQGPRGWTSDPVNGPDPTVTYTSTGQKTVKVQIKNCINQSGTTSATLTVNITQTTPLVASFQAALNTCFGSICYASTGQIITFRDASTGAEFLDYDWNHASSDPATCSFTDAGNTTPVLQHTYAVAGDFYPCLRVRRGASEQKVFVHGDINVAAGSGGGGGGGGGTPSLLVSGPSAGQINQAYTYAASASNCTPVSSAWVWNTGGGTISGDATGSSVSVTWSTVGAKTVSVTNSGCSGAQASRNVTLTDSSGGGGGGGGTGGTLQAAFGFSPTSPKPGDSVSFDASASTGGPTDYNWTFGDGSLGTGKTATHTYANAGTYVVQLSASKPSTGCPFAPCVAESKVTQTVVVGGTPPPPPVSADFTSNATCINVGGFDQCQAQTGQAVTLTAVATDATSYTWDFGDGKTGSGASVSHAWSPAGSYFVALTTVKGSSTATKSRTFVVTGTPPPTVKSVVLPWIAQTRGALVQSSDLYVHNPSSNPMTVTLEFRKRGLPESNPPRVDKEIAAGATLYVADVLREMFSRENVAGYVSLVVKQGDSLPVITSYNTTVQSDGKQFGQTIGGVSTSTTGNAVGSTPGSDVQNLVGLISNSDRLAYFGVSNPSPNPTIYHLRFFDKTGKLIGESTQDLTVSSFGQRQFQAAEIQSTFGISNEDDYRVEVQTKSGGGLVPYASNLRLSSEDPSFIEAGSSTSAKTYLIGVLSSPGLNNSIWRSDLLLSNTSAQPVTADVTFTNLGFTSTPTTPLHATLQPGETQRLENVVAGQWGIQNGIGVLTIQSNSPTGVFPIVQGESYENSTPTKRFGQSMSGVSDADAAGVGQVQYLVGLRQDASHRTTLWLFNPSNTTAQYDLIYRGLDGSVVGSSKGVLLGPGKLRQFSPTQHPLPVAGVKDGFTIQVMVKSGKVLGAAQVVNNATNDPSYIQGEVR